METSAKASINVEEAFFALARDIKLKMEQRLVSDHRGYKDCSFNLKLEAICILLYYFLCYFSLLCTLSLYLHP